MRRPLLLAAIALLVVSNAFVLAHVAMNRSGEPDSEMELTARELRNSGSRNEDSSIVLTLLWENTAPEYQSLPREDPVWFDQDKLREAGFDVTVPASSPQAARFYRNTRSREVFVALEFDGPSWERLLLRFAPERGLAVERNTFSRLVAVDAGANPAVLRTKYPDRSRVMILRALARVMLDPPTSAYGAAPARSARLRGAIMRLTTDSINVPVPLSRQFRRLPPYNPVIYSEKELSAQPPPYRATLQVGSKYEPWIVAVKPLR
jgi:uncharacterized protein DUF4824